MFNANPFLSASNESQSMLATQKLFLPDPPTYPALSGSNLQRDADQYERVTMDLGRINLQGR